MVSQIPDASERRASPHDWLVALRPHHWTKNLLVFLPLAAAHRWADWHLAAQTLAGFCLLLLLASGTYVVNDIFDLEADRSHPHKRHRPIASGALPLAHGAMFATIAIPSSIALGFLLDAGFGSMLLLYALVTLGYSAVLKRIPLLDTAVIAGLFTLRPVMGAALARAAMPAWLLGFSLLFFFSLAMAKRHAEIRTVGNDGGQSLAARGYEAADWPLTLCLGVGAALGAFTLLLFAADASPVAGRYGQPGFLWGLALLLAGWTGRIWLLVHRGRITDDPVSFALGDRASQATAALAAACFILAL